MSAEVWQVATRDTEPEWFDLKADALARVDALVDAGKVPVCVVVPLWGDQEREWTRMRENAVRPATGKPDPSGAMSGDGDDEGMGMMG